MKIYVHTNQKVVDLYTNTTGLQVVDINDIYEYYTEPIAVMMESTDDEGNTIIVQATDEDDKLLFEDVTHTVLKNAVVEFDVDRPLNRTDLELMRSTYWTNKIGYQIGFENLTPTTKDNEINLKLKTLEQEQRTADLENIIADLMLGGM